MNIASALKSGALQLQSVSATPYLDVEILLQQVLHLSREELILHGSTPIAPKDYLNFEVLLEKRKSGYSIAHIVNVKEFWKHSFFINNHTLCPRPETETIIETTLSLIKNKQRFLTIAEFGAGSGCLIISLLLEYKNALGYAFEKSQTAYQAAYFNKKKYKLESRLKLKLQPWSQCQGSFDLIATNPPYIKKVDIDSLSREVKLEPLLALSGGVTGLEAYYSILPLARKLLKKEGLLICEIGTNQWQAISELAYKVGLLLLKKVKDLQGINRCLVFKLKNFKKISL